MTGLEGVTLDQMIAESKADSAHRIAAEILTALHVKGDAARILTPAVVGYVRHQLRNEVRAAEPAPADLVAEVRRHPAPPVKARRAGRPARGRVAFVEQRFPLGNGRMVRWGEATVDDHRLRIKFLTVYRAGVSETISRHQVAVKAIEAAGVKCLNDLPALPEGVAA